VDARIKSGHDKLVCGGSFIHTHPHLPAAQFAPGVMHRFALEMRGRGECRVFRHTRWRPGSDIRKASR
jgi:hypothetical protein